MSSDWFRSIHPNSLISQLFEPGVFQFLLKYDTPQEIVCWLDDAAHLVKQMRTMKSELGGDDNFYDYSFMITPAFKALERWILVIAPALGVSEEKIKAAEELGKFGTFLNDDAIRNVVKDVEQRLQLKSEQEKELRQSLHALQVYLKNLRHSPAHCGGRIENPDRAETVFREIVGAIDRLTSHLLREGIITS